MPVRLDESGKAGFGQEGGRLSLERGKGDRVGFQQFSGGKAQGLALPAFAKAD